VQAERDFLLVSQQNKWFGLFPEHDTRQAVIQKAMTTGHIFGRQWKGKQATRWNALGCSHFSWMKNWVCCAEELALLVQSPESQ
jgi:hypothetical protein